MICSKNTIHKWLNQPQTKADKIQLYILKKTNIGGSLGNHTNNDKHNNKILLPTLKLEIVQLNHNSIRELFIEKKNEYIHNLYMFLIIYNTFESRSGLSTKTMKEICNY